ncbi:hypothetical protein AgCh_028524 [Apium graveolens]
MLEVYGLLEAFCKVIILILPYIRKQSKCPDDINDAASTLVFASAICGDLPEIYYSLESNMVVLHLLSWKPCELKIERKSLEQIGHSLQLEALPLEYTSE